MTITEAVRAAIASHSTETTDRAWDGPQEESSIPNDVSADQLRQMYAWRDPDGDPESKSTFSFIHHHWDGGPGAANLRAAVTGIGILNGGRGVNVSAQPWASDRQALYNHLAKHIRDAGEDPPPLQELSTRSVERRAFDLTDVRVHDPEDEGAMPKLGGHAAVFNRLSVPLGFQGFREKITPGAFAKTLQEADVRALLNHDPNFVLGRTKANTLRLAEDEVGLAWANDPPDTTWARDLVTSMRRRDIDQMSFGFRVPRGKDEWDRVEGQTIRTVHEVELVDVSVVTFPAYPSTDAQVRHALRQAGIDWQALSAVLTRSAEGTELNEADHRCVREAVEALRGYLPEPGLEPHSERSRKALAQRRLALADRRLRMRS